MVSPGDPEIPIASKGMSFQRGIFDLRVVCAAAGRSTKSGFPKWGRKLCLAGFLFVLFSAISGWADHPPDHSRQPFIDGLLERRLYPLAAQYCQDQLARGDLSQTRRTALVVDLSRTYTTWAIHSPPAERADRWKRAEGVIEEFLAREKENPFQMLARRQAALVPLAQGALALQETESAGEPEPFLQIARQQLHKGIRMLEQLRLDVGRQLDQGTFNENQEHLTPNQLAILRRRINAQFANALLNQARCFPEPSPERINALQRARQPLQSLAAVRNPIEWTSRLQFLTCLRLLGEVEPLRARAEQYLEEHPADDVVAGIQMELARQFSTEKKYLEALDLLGISRPSGPRVRAEIDFLELELLLVAATQTSGKKAKQWLQRASNQTHNIEREHGPYWMRRAESLLGRYVTSATGTQDAKMLARTAQGLYRAGKFPEALDLYDRAAKRAAGAGQASRAFQFAYTAAMIEHQRQKYTEARKRLLKLARENISQSQAAEAHLMGVYNFAQSLRGQPDPDLNTYLQLLREHLDHWPEAATANQARIWLAKIYEARKQWDQAAKLFDKVDPASTQFPAAVSGAATCYEQHCQALARRQDPALREEATEAANRLEAVARKLLEKPNTANATTAVIAANGSAQIRMQYTGKGFQQVDQLLQAVLNILPENSLALRARLRLLRVYALAGQRNQMAAAKRELMAVEVPPAPDLLRLIEGLNVLLANSKQGPREKLAQLQLACFEKLDLDRNGLDKNRPIELPLAEAVALAAADRSHEALTILKALALKNPQNGSVQTAYATLLLQEDDPNAWNMALAKWREIESRSQHKSPRWFEAKYAQADLQKKLGNPQQAARIIRMTQVLHPNLGGEKMKNRFMALLARCEKSGP